MVLKLCCVVVQYVFENDVKMYGTQALSRVLYSLPGFENDVKMYGTQAIEEGIGGFSEFENDVKMYDTQALDDRFLLLDRLRMM